MTKKEYLNKLSVLLRGSANVKTLLKTSDMRVFLRKLIKYDY